MPAREYTFDVAAFEVMNHTAYDTPLRAEFAERVRAGVEEHNAWAVMLTMPNGNMKLVGVTSFEWWRQTEFAYSAEILALRGRHG